MQSSSQMTERDEEKGGMMNAYRMKHSVAVLKAVAIALALVVMLATVQTASAGVAYEYASGPSRIFVFSLSTQREAS